MALSERILSHLSILAPIKKASQPVRSNDNDTMERRTRNRTIAAVLDHVPASGKAHAVVEWGVSMIDVEAFRRELDQLRLHMLVAIERDTVESPYPCLLQPAFDEDPCDSENNQAPLAEDIVTSAVRTLSRAKRN